MSTSTEMQSPVVKYDAFNPQSVTYLKAKTNKSGGKSVGIRVMLECPLMLTWGATKFTDEIINKTDPMVRGDQLMDLINLIVKFLVSHVHAFPGLAPVPVGTDGTSSQDIIQKLLDADKTILNQNIRIN